MLSFRLNLQTISHSVYGYKQGIQLTGRKSKIRYLWVFEPTRQYQWVYVSLMIIEWERYPEEVVRVSVSSHW